MRLYFSITSTLVLVAATVTPLGLVRAQEADFPVVLSALTNGDVNGDWELDVSDPLALLGHLFLGGPAPTPVLCGTEVAASQNGDANGDGGLDMSDAVHLLGFLFLGGPEPISACGLEDGGGAGATRIPVSYSTGIFEVFGEPESQWVNENGFSHLRGLPASGAPLTGDFTGTVDIIYNQKIDPDGNGVGWGTFVYDATWNGQQGNFEGILAESIESGFATGRFIGRGSGDFEGMVILGRYTGVIGLEHPHEAVVIVPSRRHRR